MEDYKKIYRQQKVFCDCGCIITKGNYSTHIKSNKHKTLINFLENDIKENLIKKSVVK
jgi:hypothetical protein